MGALVCKCEYEEILLKNHIQNYCNKKRLNWNKVYLHKIEFEKIDKHNSLSLLYYNDKNFRNKISKYKKKIITLKNIDEVDISKLYSVNTLKLYNCCKLINTEKLNLIDTLIIVHFDKMQNINKLGVVKTLILHKININNAVGLENVHTLSLMELNIKDISMLKSVHTLSIYNCNKIKDVGNLRKLKILIIDRIIYGIHLLKNLRELHLSLVLLYNQKMINIIIKLIKVNKNIKIIGYYNLICANGYYETYRFIGNRDVYYCYTKINNKNILLKKYYDEIKKYYELQYVTLIIYKKYNK
jgi:hypothetical protein